MSKEFIPLATRIKDATKKLKDAGYTVISNNDDNFAILAEKKKILCKNHNEFFKVTLELTKEAK
jgi:CDP-diacylglycerol pyrophosphatase